MTFEEAYEKIPGDGWLTEVEARLLWDTACATDGHILEVGCYKGRSTCLLAALGRTLHCVDPFAGFGSEDPSGEMAYRAFCTNLAERGWLVGNGIAGEEQLLLQTGCTQVWLYKQRIEDWKPRLIALAYLDGDHTYEGTRQQIIAAHRCAAKAILVHDYNDAGGGAEIKRACDELLGPPLLRAERLAVWR